MSTTEQQPLAEQRSVAQTSRPTVRERVLASIASRSYAYDFFQAVRLLMRVARRSGETAAPSRPVGHDYSPQSEIVRFRTLPSHTFPPAEITSLVVPPSGTSERDASPAEMTVSFMGLTGPAGALPQHYTQTVLDRIRLKDHTLRNFLDLFNHRIISLFYRAWEKHHIPPLLERAEAEGREDPFTSGVYSLVGLGLPALRNRLQTSDEFFLYYAGLFAHYPRNALSLERMLGEWLGLSTQVLQFQGQWLQLEPPEQTAMPTPARPDGLNCRLGETAIAGERVWSVESKFRIVLGPLGYDSFEQLLPGTRLLTQLGQVVRTYSGPDLDFDVQLILRREEVPPCHLSSTPSGGRRLGWNTWACSRTREQDAEEAIFVSDGRPSR